MPVRLAVVVSHPIPYFAAAHRCVHADGRVDLRVFFCCDWGLETYRDPAFGVEVKWDVPLLEGYRCEMLPIARRPQRLGFWQVDNPGVHDALKRFDPHVVMVHGYARRTNWRAARWAARHRRPVLLYSDSNALDRQGVLKRMVKRAVVGAFYANVDGALCVSDRNRAYHRRYGLPEERLFPGVIPVEGDRLLAGVGDRAAARDEVRRRFGIPADAFVVVLSGKYAAHKRPIDLLQAVDRLQQRGRNVWALLVGEGPERPRLEAHIQSAGTRAVLTGFVNQSQIAQHYVAADAVAAVSSREPLGLAIVEGATFGLPVIASDRVGAVGSSGGVRPDVNARVFPCGDVGALAEAIDDLCSDPARYRRMSEASAVLAQAQTPQTAAAKIADAAEALRALGPRRGVRLRAAGTV